MNKDRDRHDVTARVKGAAGEGRKAASSVCPYLGGVGGAGRGVPHAVLTRRALPANDVRPCREKSKERSTTCNKLVYERNIFVCVCDILIT